MSSFPGNSETSRWSALARRGAPASRTRARATGESVLAALKLAPPRVLFVDDEPWVLDGLRVGLWKSPYEICTMTDAEQALEIFRKEPLRCDRR